MINTVPTGAKPKGKPRGGSRKGIVNKTTKLAKDAIALAADRLGGTDRLVEWAQEDPKNEAAFWTSIYTKLLPLQVNAELNGKLDHSLTVTFRDA